MWFDMVFYSMVNVVVKCFYCNELACIRHILLCSKQWEEQWGAEYCKLPVYISHAIMLCDEMVQHGMKWYNMALYAMVCYGKLCYGKER